MSKDLVIKVGEYEKDGGTKGEYVRLGALLSGENGEYALLDPTINLAGCLVKQRLMNPTKASKSVMCSVFDRNNKKERPAGSDNDEPNDDIPF